MIFSRLWPLVKYFFILSNSTHSPTCRGKVPFREFRFIKGLGHNFKDSDFHCAIPTIKAGNTSFPISIFIIKSALVPTSKEYSVFIARSAHCHFIALHSIPGKELLCKSLGHHPQFLLSVPLALPALPGSALLSNMKSETESARTELHCLHSVPLPKFSYFTWTISHPSRTATVPTFF